MVVRDLPRPHEVVFCKARLGPNKKSKKKITAFDISSDESWAGSLSLLRRVINSPKNLEAAKEPTDYLEYLANKRKDHFARSVLQFDKDFRSRSKFEKVCLNDTAMRGTCATARFHATTSCVTRIASQQDATAAARSATAAHYPARPASAAICGRFNSVNGCNNQPCKYKHECYQCGKNHPTQSCPGNH